MFTGTYDKQCANNVYLYNLCV